MIIMKIMTMIKKIMIKQELNVNFVGENLMKIEFKNTNLFVVNK
jgi:hypothetical protein